MQTNKFAHTESLGSTLVHKVRRNKRNYTNWYINKAEDARYLQIIGGRTRDREFVRIVEGNILYLYDFTQYAPQTSFPPDPIQSLPTFQLNAVSFSHDPISCLKTLESFPNQTLWRIFKIPVVDISQSLWKIFSPF